MDENDGCVEPSHLRAGDKTENGLHTQYHGVAVPLSIFDARFQKRQTALFVISDFHERTDGSSVGLEVV